MKFKMPNAAEWLDMLKEIKGFETDIECAAFLRNSKQAVSHWRQGKHQMGISDCISVGTAIGVNPLFVIICNQYHSAKPENKNKWVLMAYPIEPKKPKSGKVKRLN